MNARYFDGAEARMHAVTVRVTDGLVAIDGAGIAQRIAIASTRWSAPSANAPAMLYLPGAALCEVHGDHRAPLALALGQRNIWPGWRFIRPLAAVLLLATLVAVAAFAAWFVFPAVAAVAVHVVPERADQRLGQWSLAYMEEEGTLQPSRLAPTLARETSAVLARITPPHPRVPIHLRIVNAPGIDINAFALPDGTIVVTDQLIWSLLSAPDTMNADEQLALAGILAHEIGHLEARDAVRGLIGRNLMHILSAVLFGDFSEGIAASSARLASLQYSRDREAAADTWSINRMQQLHLSLAPMAQWLENVDAWYARNENRQRPVPVYFSTHPAPSARIARFRAADQP